MAIIGNILYFQTNPYLEIDDGYLTFFSATGQGGTTFAEGMQRPRVQSVMETHLESSNHEEKTKITNYDLIHHWHMGLSENSVPLNPMVLLIIIPIKWLFHWEYTLFSDKPTYWHGFFLPWKANCQFFPGSLNNSMVLETNQSQLIPWPRALLTYVSPAFLKMNRFSKRTQRFWQLLISSLHC